jgi:hypothetical protein
MRKLWVSVDGGPNQVFQVFIEFIIKGATLLATMATAWILSVSPLLDLFLGLLSLA